MMILRKLLFLLLLTLLTVSLHAQWTKEDSLWIEGVKSGRIKPELNPEVKKAIEEGRLIEAEKPNAKLLEQSSQLPISKEFTAIRPEDEEYRIIDLSDLPPALIIRLTLPDSIARGSFVYVAPPKDYISMKQIPIGTKGIYITAHSGVLDPIVKDGQSKGVILGGIGYSFSMEELLRHIFMPSERAKKRNKKYAVAWKTY